MTFETWTTKKTRGPLLSIESWLFNRDPYNGLWNHPHLTVQYNLLYTLNNQGPIFSLLTWVWGSCSYHLYSWHCMKHASTGNIQETVAPESVFSPTHWSKTVPGCSWSLLWSEKKNDCNINAWYVYSLNTMGTHVCFIFRGYSAHLCGA